MTEQTPSPAPLRLYGRRKGKPLRPRHQHLMQDFLPQVSVTLDDLAEPQKIFSHHPSTVMFEIGFGAGDHLAQLAHDMPNAGFLGAEPFMNGVASLLKKMDDQALTNIRIFAGDARMVLEALPPQSLDAVFLLFPDPWPKNRHANRRFIGPDNLNRLARAMKSGAELRMASDVPPLATWMQKHTLADDRFAPHAGTESGQWPHRPAHWPTTRYEQKNLAKHPPAWLSFYRR